MKKTIRLTESGLHRLIKESVRKMISESWADARPNETKLYNMLEDGLIDAKELALNLMGWFSDDELGRFAESEGYFDNQDIEDDIADAEEEEEEEEDDKEVVDF